MIPCPICLFAGAPRVFPTLESFLEHVEREHGAVAVVRQPGESESTFRQRGEAARLRLQARIRKN